MTHSVDLRPIGRRTRNLRSSRWFVVLLLVSVSACGGQSVTFVASKAKIGPADTVTLSGAFRDAEGGLEVGLESSTGGTAFEPTGQTTTTASSGAFTFSYKPSSPGMTNLRAVLVKGGKSVTTDELTVTVLEATSIKTRLGHSTEVGLGEKGTLVGAVSPAERGRAVTLEASTDGETWVSVGAPATTDGEGSFMLSAPTDAYGAIQVRATAIETLVHEAASGKAFKIFVVDYEAAAAQYQSCVEPANTAGDATNTAVGRYTAGTIPWSALKKTTMLYAQAVADEIRCLEDHSWPPSIAGIVRDLAQQEAVVLDATRKATAAKTSDAYFAAFGTDFRSATDKGASDAKKIRRALELPARTG